MKKAIAIVLSVIFVFAVASVSFATEAKKEAAPAEKKEAAPAKAEKKATAKQVTGEVAAVDAKANTITVKGKKGDVVISVPADAKVMAGKEKKAVADVKAGDKVTVKYMEAEGKNTAKSIEIKAAPAKKEEKKTEKKAEEKKEAAPAAAPAKKEAAPAKKSGGY